jgi:hypothetical protein
MAGESPAADFAATASPALRTMACAATRYLRVRGSFLSSRDLADTLRGHWRDQLGDDAPHTLAATSNLAAAPTSWVETAPIEPVAQLVPGLRPPR